MLIAKDKEPAPFGLLYPVACGFAVLLLMWGYMVVASKVMDGGVGNPIALGLGLLMLGTGIADIRSGSSRILRCLGGEDGAVTPETVFAYWIVGWLGGAPLLWLYCSIMSGG